MVTTIHSKALAYTILVVILSQHHVHTFISSGWRTLSLSPTTSTLPSKSTSTHALNPALSADSGSIKREGSGGFDIDFADAMSKPLPRWYEDQKQERAKLMKEIQNNRERIIREFRAKYEVSESEKTAEREAKWEKIRNRVKKRKAEKKSWVKGVVASLVKSRADQALDELAEDINDEMEKEEDASSETTKEKWEKFWEEEEKQTGFALPGFFEVFPELQLKWPKWSRDKNGQARKCERDEDCPFPQACCPHPIVPGEKFCCTGFGQRMMVPAYAKQQIASSPLSDSGGGGGSGSGGSGGRSWMEQDSAFYGAR